METGNGGMFSLRHRSAAVWVAVVVASVLVGAGGSALASQLSGGIDSYTGCLTSSGELVKFTQGGSPLKPCTGNQVQVSFSAPLPQDCLSGQVLKWNGSMWACAADDVGGSSGADAFVSIRAQDNPIVPPTGVLTQLVTLRLEPGRYQVTGKVGLHNRDPQLPFRTQCALVPSNEDGTPREPGALGSDWGFLHLARAGSPGEEDAVSLFVSQELSQPGTVVLSCSGNGNQFGAFANYGTIRAIEVASITTYNQSP